MLENKFSKRKSALFLAILIGILTILPLVKSPQITNAESMPILNFDETKVLDDLSSSQIGGKPFDIKDYPRIDGEKMRLLTFIEYCYSYKINMQQNYGLYLYVYNPSGIDVDTDNFGNKIQLAVAYDEDGAPAQYEKFSLKFCSTIESGEHRQLFYKFRLIDHISDSDDKTILQRVNSSERRYDISGFELTTKGADNAIDYTVGGTYKYTGYVKGYGADLEAPDNLNCKVNDLETIELIVEDTFFRTGVSSLGVGHQNQVNSVYFSVPMSMMERYGSLQKIKAEWYEYKTEPIFITKYYDAYTDFKQYTNKVLGDNHDSSVPFQIHTGKIGTPVAAIDWSYNVSGMNFSTIKCKNIPFVFYANSDLTKYTLPESEIKTYIKNYEHSTKGYLPIKDGKTISADLFSNKVDANRKLGHNVKEFDANDDTFNLLSYDSTHSGWQKFLDFGFWVPDTSGDYRDKSPIATILRSDLAENNEHLSKNLMINIDDVQNFKDYCNAKITNLRQPILFRFAQTDYFSRLVYVETPKNLGISSLGDGAIAYETVFFDFDILQLTFNKEGKFTTIAAVSNPIDIINPITPPLAQSDLFSQIIVILLYILVVLVAIVLGVIIYKLIRYFYKKSNNNDDSDNE